MVIAAITSCTNASNPSVMVAAGLLARKAIELGLGGTELFDFQDVSSKPKEIEVTATKDDGSKLGFQVSVRIDTPKEWDYFAHGGILHYVLRRLASE